MEPIRGLDDWLARPYEVEDDDCRWHPRRCGCDRCVEGRERAADERHDLEAEE